MADAGTDQGPSPSEVRDPLIRDEIRKAGVWFGLGLAIALVVLLIQPLLLIFSGIVLATMFDGGVRLLGRVTKLGRGWRLLIVVLGVTLFICATFYLMGVGVWQQVSQLRSTLESQTMRVTGWLSAQGLMPGAQDISGLARQALGSVGKLTSWVGTAVGALTSFFFILVLGLFFAMDPRLYERGLTWMAPEKSRAEFTLLLGRMGFTLRRLLWGRLIGMVVEGVLTWIALWIAGVPLPALLGIITGILAFIPNIGAFVSGVLMVAVGFSAGENTGIWAIVTYVVIQTFDGYVVAPYVARKTVDVPPALTLGNQILASALFGLLGLALADPFTALAKVVLERRAEREGERRASRSA